MALTRTLLCHGARDVWVAGYLQTRSKPFPFHLDRCHMSALGRKTDLLTMNANVRLVPKADVAAYRAKPYCLVIDGRQLRGRSHRRCGKLPTPRATSEPIEVGA